MAAAVTPVSRGGDPPQVTNPRATDGDERFEPNWDERLTITVGEKSGDLSSPEFGKAQDQFTALNGYQLEPKAKKILHGLGFKSEDFNKPAREYSGGWVMRAHLAQLLTMEPDLLMLDEPTNHLDLISLLWLQRYLLNYSGAILMISHDRDFMDTIIETVVEIDPDAAALISYTGNYSAFLDQREKRYDLQVQAYRNQNKEIEAHQEFIERFRQVGSKAAQVQSRIKMVEKIVRILREMGHEPATPAEARAVLGLKGSEDTDF